MNIDDGDQETASVAETEFRESAWTANERLGAEELDEWAPHAVEEDEPE